MTTVVFEYVERPGEYGLRKITATGHAGKRDACIAVTFTLRTLAHVLDALGILDHVEQSEEPPRFVVGWTVKPPARRAIVDEIVWLLDKLAIEYPGHLQIVRADDVRHDGERLPQSA